MALKPCKRCGTQKKERALKCVNGGKILPNASKTELFGYGFLGYILIGFIGMMITDPIDFQAISSTNQPAGYNERLSDHAINMMTPDQYPSAYKKWGAEKIEWLNSLQHSVAVYALKNFDCPYFDSLALSPSRSLPPQQAVFYVDCKDSMYDQNYATYRKYYIDVRDLN